MCPCPECILAVCCNFLFILSLCLLTTKYIINTCVLITTSQETIFCCRAQFQTYGFQIVSNELKTHCTTKHNKGRTVVIILGIDDRLYILDVWNFEGCLIWQNSMVLLNYDVFHDQMMFTNDKVATFVKKTRSWQPAVLIVAPVMYRDWTQYLSALQLQMSLTVLSRY